MKKILILISSILISTSLMAAGGDGGGSSSGNGNGDSKVSLYNDAVKLVKRAGKLEKKEKAEKAKKLYSQAFKKLEKAYKSDKKNPDVLNYMGFTSRKIGDFRNAEIYYLLGLEIDPKHKGINEYLGELYVNTNRIDKAKERLKILEDCNCEEYEELSKAIKSGSSKY